MDEGEKGYALKAVNGDLDDKEGQYVSVEGETHRPDFSEKYALIAYFCNE